MLARSPPLFPSSSLIPFPLLPVQLSSSYLGGLHQRSNHPEAPWAPPSVTTAPMRKMAQHDHLRASASCPTTPFLFHGLALDDDAGRRHSFVKCLSFPDRQCPAHATNLDAAPLRPSSKQFGTNQSINPPPAPLMAKPTMLPGHIDWLPQHFLILGRSPSQLAGGRDRGILRRDRGQWRKYRMLCPCPRSMMAQQ
jgi:hypothetical protein